MVEPFAIADVVEAIRSLGSPGEALVIDLRTGVATPAPTADDAPWWASR